MGRKRRGRGAAERFSTHDRDDADILSLLDRFPIVEPDPGHTKLRLSREGLEAIERITSPISAVAVS